MKQPENPYTDKVNWYNSRPFSLMNDAAWDGKIRTLGARDGWDEGVGVGEQRYFNVDSENDCADTLFTYLTKLRMLIEMGLGEDCAMATLIRQMLVLLEYTNVPVAD